MCLRSLYWWALALLLVNASAAADEKPVLRMEICSPDGASSGEPDLRGACPRTPEQVEEKLAQLQEELKACGDIEGLEASLSDDYLPSETALMRIIAEHSDYFSPTIDRFKQCLEAFDSETCKERIHIDLPVIPPEEKPVNRGDIAVTSERGYSRSVRMVVLNFKIFDYQKYHYAAESSQILSRDAAEGEAREQEALAGTLGSMATTYEKMLKEGRDLRFPYTDLDKTVESLREYEKIAEDRAEALKILACRVDKLARMDRVLENDESVRLKSLVRQDGIVNDAINTLPKATPAHSNVTGKTELPGSPIFPAPPPQPREEQKGFVFGNQGNQVMERAPAAVPAPASPVAKEDDSLFGRIHDQMRKREGNSLAPAPYGLSDESFKIGSDFRLVPR